MPGKKTGTTREQILHMLKIEGSLTVSDIASRLGITEMAVRRHLGTLERDELIVSSLQRQALGRPTYMYSLSEKGQQSFPHNYQDFMLDLLRDIRDTEGDDKVRTLFRRREQRLYDHYGRQIKGDSLEERISQLVEIQNREGFMAEWERNGRTGEYVLIEYNCPISAVAREFAHICRTELSLFKKVLPGTEVIQHYCLAKGGEHCRYTIKETSRPGGLSGGNPS